MSAANGAGTEVGARDGPASAVPARPDWMSSPWGRCPRGREATRCSVCQTGRVPVAAPLPSAPVPSPGVGVGLGAEHVVRVMVLVSRVTAPLRASRRPWKVAPVERRDVGEGEHVADELRAGVERRRAADLPHDVAGVGAVDEEDPAVRPR